jgi:ribosomal protein S18 acetylase RimI-like enzyme
VDGESPTLSGQEGIILEYRLRIRAAKSTEHKEICRIAKQSQYTKDFSNMIFSGVDCYAEGKIRVAVSGKTIVGFTCFRHRQRDNVTVLYFVGVETSRRNRGVGLALMEDLRQISTGIIEFKVMKDNQAVRFYRRLGFKVIGQAYEGKAWIMQQKTPED